MKKLIAKNLSRRGANFVEYLILVGVIGLAGIGIFQIFGGKVGVSSKKQGEKVEQLGGGGGGGGDNSQAPVP